MRVIFLEDINAYYVNISDAYQKNRTSIRTSIQCHRNFNFKAKFAINVFYKYKTFRMINIYRWFIKLYIVLNVITEIVMAEKSNIEIIVEQVSQQNLIKNSFAFNAL